MSKSNAYHGFYHSQKCAVNGYVRKYNETNMIVPDVLLPQILRSWQEKVFFEDCDKRKTVAYSTSRLNEWLDVKEEEDISRKYSFKIVSVPHWGFCDLSFNIIGRSPAGELFFPLFTWYNDGTCSHVRDNPLCNLTDQLKFAQDDDIHICYNTKRNKIKIKKNDKQWIIHLNPLLLQSQIRDTIGLKMKMEIYIGSAGSVELMDHIQINHKNGKTQSQSQSKMVPRSVQRRGRQSPPQQRPQQPFNGPPFVSQTPPKYIFNPNNPGIPQSPQQPQPQPFPVYSPPQQQFPVSGYPPQQPPQQPPQAPPRQPVVNPAAPQRAVVSISRPYPPMNPQTRKQLPPPSPQPEPKDVTPIVPRPEQPAPEGPINAQPPPQTHGDKDGSAAGPSVGSRQYRPSGATGGPNVNAEQDLNNKLDTHQIDAGDKPFIFNTTQLGCGGWAEAQSSARNVINNDVTGYHDDCNGYENYVEIMKQNRERHRLRHEMSYDDNDRNGRRNRKINMNKENSTEEEEDDDLIGCHSKSSWDKSGGEAGGDNGGGNRYDKGAPVSRLNALVEAVGDWGDHTQDEFEEVGDDDDENVMTDVQQCRSRKAREMVPDDSATFSDQDRLGIEQGDFNIIMEEEEEQNINDKGCMMADDETTADEEYID